jgi:alpha-glucosidase (family GH31 glycosyl hydrolase)
MTLLNHQAVMKSHPQVVNVVDDENTTKCYDAGGNEVTLDEAKYKAAKVDEDQLIYQLQRREEYPYWADQLDYIYHHGIDKWKTDMIDPIKKKYPKP